MKKVELIEKIADRTGATKKDVSVQLDETIRVIEEELSRGEDIAISGLGTFKVTHRNARQGRNPQTGEAIMIKASNGVSFKAAKNLKEKVN